MNKAELLGRLTQDIEIKKTENDNSVINFSIAVNRRFAKEGQQTADFIDYVAWNNTAEHISKYYKKGDMIAVVGSIQTSNWIDDDGNKHYSTKVLVEEVYFTGNKKDRSDNK